MKLTFLGTGGSTPTKDRNVPATAVQVGSKVLLFDCGEGSQRQLLHTPVSFMKITDIFITHFHGDHFLGLPALFQTMNLNERSEPLRIYGPKGGARMVGVFRDVGYFRPRFDIEVLEVGEGMAVELGDIAVSAIGAEHGVPSLSYRLQEKERPGKFNKPRALELGVPEGRMFGQLQNGESVQVGDSTITPDMVLGPPRAGRALVFTGDTRPHEGLTEFARDCDVLVHDATFSHKELDKARDFGHSTAVEAAQTARDCGARELFLTHFSPRYEGEEEKLLLEAREMFPRARLAADLEEFVVTFRD